MTTPPIPLRPSDLADEFEARARASTALGAQANADVAPSYAAWTNAMLEAAALARGEKALEHAEPEIIAHQPVVIEIHSPASIGRMSEAERQKHRDDVLQVIRSMQVQLDRVDGVDTIASFEAGATLDEDGAVSLTLDGERVGHSYLPPAVDGDNTPEGRRLEVGAEISRAAELTKLLTRQASLHVVRSTPVTGDRYSAIVSIRKG